MEPDSRLEPLVVVWGTAVVATSDFRAGHCCWVQIVVWIKDDFCFQDTVFVMFVKGFLSVYPPPPPPPEFIEHFWHKVNKLSPAAVICSVALSSISKFSRKIFLFPSCLSVFKHLSSFLHIWLQSGCSAHAVRSVDRLRRSQPEFTELKQLQVFMFYSVRFVCLQSEIFSVSHERRVSLLLNSTETQLSVKSGLICFLDFMFCLYIYIIIVVYSFKKPLHDCCETKAAVVTCLLCSDDLCRLPVWLWVQSISRSVCLHQPLPQRRRMMMMMILF